MITEIAQIEVKPGMEAEFETGVKKAAPIFKRAKGCRGHGAAALGRKSRPATGCSSPGRRSRTTPTISAARPTSRNGASWSPIASPRRPRSSTSRRCCAGFEPAGAVVVAALAAAGAHNGRPHEFMVPAFPHWRCAPARRIRGGRLRRARRRRRGWLRATDWRSTAGCGFCRKLLSVDHSGPGLMATPAASAGWNSFSVSTWSGSLTQRKMPPFGSSNSAAVPNCSLSASISVSSFLRRPRVSSGTWASKCAGQNSPSTICSSAPEPASVLSASMRDSRSHSATM